MGGPGNSLARGVPGPWLVSLTPCPTGTQVGQLYLHVYSMILHGESAQNRTRVCVSNETVVVVTIVTIWGKENRIKRWHRDPVALWRSLSGHKPHGSTSVHIPSDPTHPGTTYPGHMPGCYLGSHDFLSNSLSLNLCLCPPLLCIIFLSLLSFSTCILGLCHFQALSCTFCPSLPVFLSLSLCLSLTVSAPLCASLTPLSLLPFCALSLSPSSSTSLSVSFSIYLCLVIPISLPLSLLYPSLLPFPFYPTQGPAEEPTPSPTCFPPPKPHGGQEVEATVSGCPPSPAPPSPRQPVTTAEPTATLASI